MGLFTKNACIASCEDSLINVLPVVLSGGSGTRLWPRSRAKHPKQFIDLHGEGSLFQQTIDRVRPLSESPLVICNEAHRFLVAEQLRVQGVKASAIVLEPSARNTAPAIALAALAANAEGEDPVMLVLPSDHVIGDPDAFLATVDRAMSKAVSGSLLTFGVVVERPETGYGYIRSQGKGISPVREFVEKPDAETARAYMESGDYYWNSGMFMFRASAYLNALQLHAPLILAAARQAFEQAERDADFLRIDKAAFERCPSDSIDYAIMEKTDQAVVAPLSAAWSDVGSWDALWQICDKDDRGNVAHGDVITEDVSNTLIHSENRLVTAIGLRNCIVVDTDDALLVADMSRAQDIKTLVSKLEGRDVTDLHSKVYRPWGSYQGVDTGERFQVKRIVVKPGASLSLQMHHHRAEHWIVVRGTARVTRGEDSFMLTEDQSTYIPIGAVHRLENPGNIPLELVEVQSGSYLGEDDIIRIQDEYGRGQARERRKKERRGKSAGES